jgi:hypothetical protein
MKAASIAETWVIFYQTTRRYIPEDSHFLDLYVSFSHLWICYENYIETSHNEFFLIWVCHSLPVKEWAPMSLKEFQLCKDIGQYLNLVLFPWSAEYVKY